MAAMTRSLHLPENWLRAAVAGAEAAVLTWLVAVLGALVTYVATAAAPGLGNATWSSTAAIGTGWWTMAFGGRVPVEGGTAALAPLGLTLLALVLLRGAMSRLAVDTLDGAAISAGVGPSPLPWHSWDSPPAVGAVSTSPERSRSVSSPRPGRSAATEAPSPARVRRWARACSPGGVTAGLGAAGVGVLGAVVAGALLVVGAVVSAWGEVAAIHQSRA